MLTHSSPQFHTPLETTRSNLFLPPTSTSPLALISHLTPSLPDSSLLTPPHLYQTLTHHWDLISKDTNLKQLFSPPQLCFRREKAVSNHLVSAKRLGRPPPPTANVPLQISTTAKRVQPCNHPLCFTCPKLLPTTSSIPALHINPSTSPIPSPVRAPGPSTATSVQEDIASRCM